MTVLEVAQAVGGTVHGVTEESAGHLVVERVVTNSRAAGPGALFVAFTGERVDGHDFAEAAVGAGAVAVLGARSLAVPTIVVADVVAALGALAAATRRRFAPASRVIAITGSSGKTSTKDLLAAVLEPAGPTIAPQNSFNNDIGLPLTLLTATTETTFVILEMGARGLGHVARLCALSAPDIGLILNVGRAHVGEFGDLETTAAAKGELAEAAHVAVLNADDARVAALAGRAPGRVVLFGRGDGAQVRARDVRVSAAHAEFTLTAGGDQAPVRLSVLGEHQVANALGAAAVAWELGIPLTDIANRLSAATARSRWRMELTERGDGVTVLNDAYNANPESTTAALHTLADLATPDGQQPRRSWAVLGEMAELGNAAEASHREIGRLAVSLAVSHLVVVGDGAAAIHAEAVRVKTDQENRTSVVLVRDVGEAAAFVRDRVQPGDVVLVKGSRVAGLEVVAAELLAASPEVAR